MLSVIHSSHAPTVDYEVRTVFRRDGTFDMTGFHDQAPHHEIYITRGEGSKWLTIHLSKSKGLAVDVRGHCVGNIGDFQISNETTCFDN